VVRPSARTGALAAALRCLKRLVPGATLLVASPSPVPASDGDVIALDAEEIAAGPLAAASAIEREREANRKDRPERRVRA
jgi:hypothetical protein